MVGGDGTPFSNDALWGTERCVEGLQRCPTKRDFWSSLPAPPGVTVGPHSSTELVIAWVPCVLLRLHACLMVLSVFQGLTVWALLL
jgi:hypothetical protein